MSVSYKNGAVACVGDLVQGRCNNLSMLHAIIGKVIAIYEGSHAANIRIATICEFSEVYYNAKNEPIVEVTKAYGVAKNFTLLVERELSSIPHFD